MSEPLRLQARAASPRLPRFTHGVATAIVSIVLMAGYSIAQPETFEIVLMAIAIVSVVAIQSRNSRTIESVYALTKRIGLFGLVGVAFPFVLALLLPTGFLERSHSAESAFRSLFGLSTRWLLCSYLYYASVVLAARFLRSRPHVTKSM